MNRNASIVISVITLHVAVLWAVQTGLQRHMAEVVAPAEILVEIMASAAPVPAPQPLAALPVPTLPRPVQPATRPPAIAPSETAPESSTAIPNAVATASAAPSATPTLGGKSTEPPALAAPPLVALPSSAADYLNNARPPYPALSKRMGEQGKVVVRVWIDTEGVASQASVQTPSGFERLDRAAVNTVLGWRYVPGKRAGAPQAMWFDVPVNWVLQ
jgi:protein TonB